MEAVRVSWADERMDDLNHKVDDLREEMRAEFKDVRTEIKALRSEIRSEIQDMRQETRFEIVATREAMDARFDSMQRAMLWTMGTMLVVVASILAGAQL